MNSRCRAGTWISIVIDNRRTGGLWVHRTLEAVAVCLTRAVLPKDAWLVKRDVDAEWLTWGFAAVDYADNGAKFARRDSVVRRSTCPARNTRALSPQAIQELNALRASRSDAPGARLVPRQSSEA